MDKGIRPFVNAKFVELLPQRPTLGNTGFRKTVIAETMEAFGCTLASAATHYNHAFKLVKVSNPESVAGLGRPEDKKGGRKKKVIVETPAAAPAAAVETPTPEAPVETPQGVVPPVESTGEENVQAVQEMLDTTNVVWPHTKVKVIRKRDGVEVGEFTIPEAQEMIAAAKASKKASLEIAPTVQETAPEAAQ